MRAVVTLLVAWLAVGFIVALALGPLLAACDRRPEP
jgi:hypothetical protein